MSVTQSCFCGTNSRWLRAAARSFYRVAGSFSPGLFLAEAIQPHDFGALARLCGLVLILPDRRRCRHDRRGRGCRKVCRRCLRDGIGRLELQAELHRGVEEALDGVERNHQALGNAPEWTADLETHLHPNDA